MDDRFDMATNAGGITAVTNTSAQTTVLLAARWAPASSTP